MDEWREDSVKSLFDRIKTSMPGDSPSTLSDQQYVDVLTFILKNNGFPGGRKELGTNDLDHVLITGRDGPQPLPNGALVQTVGCLAKLTETAGSVTKASPFTRTRIRRNLTSNEMKIFEQQRNGRETLVLSTKMFRQFFSRSFDLPSLINHKVVVAGTLVRKTSDVYIEVVRVQDVAGNCS